MIVYVRDKSGGNQAAFNAYDYEFHQDNKHDSSFNVFGAIGTDVYEGGVLIIPSVTALIIKTITPGTDNNTTALKCSPLISLFSRSIEWQASTNLGATISALIASDFGAGQTDSYFRYSWLTAQITSTADYPAPETDEAGYFDFKSWLDSLEDAGIISLYADPTNNGVTLKARSAGSRVIIFGSSDYTLKSESYSNTVVSRITNHTIEDDTVTDTDYYLFSDGSYSTDPSEGTRVNGSWKHCINKMEEDVSAEFSKNSYNHKLAFYSRNDIKSGEHIRCRMADGRIVNSIVTCVKLSSKDDRLYYEAGILKTTLTELLGGI